jgi:hypothetical protein
LKLRCLLLGLLLCFEAANFTGFSWTHLRRLSDDELINAAIQFNYPDIYSNLAELKADYSSFNPEIYYWIDLTGEIGTPIIAKLFGFKRFQVRLPDAAVTVASDGTFRRSRRCSEKSWCRPTIAPDRRVLGIVGTVQDGTANDEAAKEFSVEWVDGSQGTVVISGPCFAAFSHSQKPALRIIAPGDTKSDNFVINDAFGYRLMNVPDINHAAYSATKIPEREFTQLRACDRSVQALTPGGERWQEKFKGISD